MRLVVPSDEIDHGDIALLAVTMAAPDALFDSLRVPRQIVIDNGLAKLQVQTFCARLGAYQHFRTRPKLVHEGKAYSNFATRPYSRRKPGSFLLLPPRECLLRTVVIVDATEQSDVILAEADIEKQMSQVFLRRDRFGENNGLAAAPTIPPQIQHHFDGFLERSRLRIIWKRPRTGYEILNAYKLGGKTGDINPWVRPLGWFVHFVVILKVPEHVVRSFVDT